MIGKKQQYVSDIMDDMMGSDTDVDTFIHDPEMHSIWSRYHLVRDVMQGNLPEAIDPEMDVRIAVAIQSEPTLLVPDARNQVASVGSHFKNWAEQATSFAIAASVMAIMIFGAQTLNTPESVNLDNSAITSLELLNVDNTLIADKTEYTDIQELLLEHTRVHSLYGFQHLTNLVSVVNHTIPVILKPTSDRVYYNLDKEEGQDKKDNLDEQSKASDKR
ncbi:MAG: hypothetical protein GY808_02520 [Gammaproteobacteria bacterium]|nr:hypothetical protein [Gammaproteobacteria bacterium]